jgi:CDP-glucose 4,6-dehydratase
MKNSTITIPSSLEVFNGAKVLVTGHTGFKGTWLSLWLNQIGAKVTGVALDIPSEPSHFNAAVLSEKLTDYRLDIRDGAALKAIIKKVEPDFIFHLAAQPLVRRSYAEPVDTWQTNTMGTINLLEALRVLDNDCTAVFITSDKCYDNVEWVWGYRETDALGGPDPYSASKGAAELAIRSYIRSFFPADGNIRIAVGRAGNVIGGGDWAEDRIVSDCMRAWSVGENVSLRNPSATRPWQHVLEPLSGYLSLASSLHEDVTLHGEPFNFGPPGHQNQSVGDLVEEMTKYWDQVRWTDISEKYGGPYESGLLKLNCDKALYHLKWQAVWGFEETVRETVLWYRHYYEQPLDSIAGFSLEQIDAYIDSARQQGKQWAK